MPGGISALAACELGPRGRLGAHRRERLGERPVGAAADASRPRGRRESRIASFAWSTPPAGSPLRAATNACWISRYARSSKLGVLGEDALGGLEMLGRVGGVGVPE